MKLLELPELKIIGALCMIDQGELDWKLFAVEASYAQEFKIRDEYTFSQKNPGQIKEVVEWMRTYKTYDGKALNTFGYDEKIFSVDDTIEIIQDCHKQYQDLMIGRAENPDNELVLE